MKADLVLRGGTLVIPGQGLVRAGVAIHEGKISAVGREDLLPSATRVIDVEGRFVLPGIIDPHVHFGLMGDLGGDCRTETRSALAGGVTTVGAFIREPDSHLKSFDKVTRTLETNSSIDIFPHFEITSEAQALEIPECARRFGVTSFKMFMSGIPLKGASVPVDDGVLLEAFRQIAGLGPSGLALVHAENPDIIILTRARIGQRKPKGNLADWADCHPNLVEEEAVSRSVYLAGKAGCRIYIVHVSTAEALQRLRELRKRNKTLYAETCSPYLTLTKHSEMGLLAKLIPPLRDTEDREALWAGMDDDVIDSLGTDNILRTRAYKQIDQGLIGAKGAAAFLGVHLPVLLDEGCHRRRFPLDRLVDKMTRQPARIFGLFPKKGTIAPGTDADLVVVDLDKVKTVRTSELHTSSDFNLYEGKRIRGWPVMTIKGGAIAVQDGDVLIEPGCGKVLRRPL
ncbi:MAG: amidohydrolase family protein [bacterium]